MTTIDLLLRHNAWATRVLLDDARKLTEAQFHKDLPIGPGSIYNALVHIIGAMERWSDRLARRPLRERLDKGDRRHTVDELIGLLDKANADLTAIARGMIESDDLDGELVDTFGDKEYRFTHHTVFVHVMTHGVHHRAQVLNMRRQLGLEPLEFELDACEAELVAEGRWP